MDYKKINVEELGLKQKIIYNSSRVAYFVPKLLSKLPTKLVVEPIVKGLTGHTHEEIKAGADDIVAQIKNEQATELEGKITEGKQVLADWRNDKFYLQTNLAMYKSYESYINDLEKKRVRILKSPRRILVAKAYLATMLTFRSIHKKELETAKIVKEQEAKKAEMFRKKIEEYQVKKAAVLSAGKELESLRQALREAQKNMDNTKLALETFREENKDLVDQVDAQDAASLAQSTTTAEAQQPVFPSVAPIVTPSVGDSISIKDYDGQGNVVSEVTIPTADIPKVEPIILTPVSRGPIAQQVDLERAEIVDAQYKDVQDDDISYGEVPPIDPKDVLSLSSPDKLAEYELDSEQSRTR